MISDVLPQAEINLPQSDLPHCHHPVPSEKYEVLLAKYQDKLKTYDKLEFSYQERIKSLQAQIDARKSVQELVPQSTNTPPSALYTTLDCIISELEDLKTIF